MASSKETETFKIDAYARERSKPKPKTKPANLPAVMRGDQKK